MTSSCHLPPLCPLPAFHRNRTAGQTGNAQGKVEAGLALAAFKKRQKPARDAKRIRKPCPVDPAFLDVISQHEAMFTNGNA